MTQAELNKILELHKKWLNDEPDGKKADLSNADLRYANLRYANLRDADLRYANLRNADLRYANLRNADLRYANLRDADLRYADLRFADLRNSDLRFANLRNADLRYANLRDADLRYANLRNADLRNSDLRDADLSNADLSNANLRDAKLSGAKLEGIIYDENTAFFALQCPEDGSFVGWKKCRDDTIVKLLIPEDAKRSSATTRKCRCDKARVLEIWDKNGRPVQEARSSHNPDFVYRVGEMVYVPDFDEDRWKKCATGIHFFITRREAELYE